MSKYRNKLVTTSIVAGLGLAAIPALAIALGASSSASATGVSGNVQLNTEVSTSLAMKIASPNDTNPDCLPESGVTYGTVNRYATSNGAEGSKQVDTFDGTIGGADEINNNTSCATLTMSPNTFSSTYSDITVYTNSPNGYALSVRSADNTSPDLVNTTNYTGTDEQHPYTIPAGVLTEQDGTGEQAGQKIVPGAQNKWAIKGDTNSNLDTWTAVTTLDQTVRAYDTGTSGGSQTRVTYGISSGNNPVGKYATTLTYTATMFDGDNPYVPDAEISSNGNISTSTSDLKVPYNETRPLTITPNAGYYIASLTCSSGYTCTDENGDPIVTGDATTGPITAYVTNSNKTGTGEIAITTAPVQYAVAIANDPSNAPGSLTISPVNLNVPYGESRTVTITPATGYYLESYTCADGYTCETDTTTGSINSANGASNANAANSDPFAGILYENVSAAGDNTIETGEDAIYAQTIKITNKNTLGGGTVSFKTAKRHFTISISGTNSDLATDQTSLSILYGESATVTVTPSTGHYLASISCPTGYTCTKEDDSIISTGDNTAARAAQTIKVANNNTADSGTLTLAAGTSEYTVSVSGTNTTVSPTSVSVPYGGSKTIDITPSSHYYLSSVSCPSGYTCSGYNTGTSYTGKQTITITNNNTTSGGTLTATSTIQSYEVAITPSVNATTSTNSLSVPYGGSKTFAIAPNAGYYLTGVTCSSGYTCTGYSTGSASNPSATSRSTQTITVTNNSSTNTGAISFTLANTYRISFSKTNISSPSASYVDVAYGGQTTVTVTPASVYYLSGFSGCPEGYTCSGISTGTSYINAQTLTLKNNNSVKIGTLTMSGTVKDMQDFSCSMLPAGVTGRIRDKRDSKEYTIAKLKDGKCWMTSNLRLQNYTLKSTDSNVSTNFSLPASGVNAFCTTANSTNCDGRPNVLDSGNESYGVYYNWYAATAGTGTYKLSSGEAPSSICPKGWRLPTVTEYDTLYKQYGSSEKLRDTGAGQPAFVLSGNRYGSSTGLQGSYGDYWSSTPKNNYYVYNLLMDDANVYPLDNYYKHNGLTVRCVASS